MRSWCIAVSAFYVLCAAIVLASASITASRVADVRVHAEIITRLPECLSLDYSPMEDDNSLFYASGMDGKLAQCFFVANSGGPTMQIFACKCPVRSPQSACCHGSTYTCSAWSQSPCNNTAPQACCSN